MCVAREICVLPGRYVCCQGDMCVAREICVLPGRYMCGAKDIYVHKRFKFLFHKNDNIMVPLVLQ